MERLTRLQTIQRCLVYAAQYERVGMPLSAQAEREYAEFLATQPDWALD